MDIADTDVDRVLLDVWMLEQYIKRFCVVWYIYELNRACFSDYICGNGQNRWDYNWRDNVEFSREVKNDVKNDCTRLFKEHDKEEHDSKQ